MAFDADGSYLKLVIDRDDGGRFFPLTGGVSFKLIPERDATGSKRASYFRG